MKHGPAWIIFEESRRDGSRRLLSILPSRKSAWDVARFVKQSCIDRYASIEERLCFKKGRPLTAFDPMVDGHVMHCGDDPFIVGIRAQQTTLRGNILEFHYRVITRRGARPADIVHESRVQHLLLEK